MKGIFKAFKFITRIFVVKEKEMEIGNPTDVKHVAHIGTDGSSSTAPSWMTEFKNSPNFSATTVTNPRDSSQGNDQPKHKVSDKTSHQQNAPRKPRRKKKASSTALKNSKSNEACQNQKPTPNL